MDHTFRVPDLFCRITGTDDYTPNLNEDVCMLCTYRQACNAKHDDQELAEAKEMWMEAKRLEDEASKLELKAKEIFGKTMKASGLIKFQFDNFVISSIYVKESVTYPKAKLLKLFTLEELAPASEKKEAYTYLRIDDLLKK